MVLNPTCGIRYLSFLVPLTRQELWQIWYSSSGLFDLRLLSSEHTVQMVWMQVWWYDTRSLNSHTIGYWSGTFTVVYNVGTFWFLTVSSAAWWVLREVRCTCSWFFLFVISDRISDKTLNAVVNIWGDTISKRSILQVKWIRFYHLHNTFVEQLDKIRSILE